MIMVVPEAFRDEALLPGQKREALSVKGRFNQRCGCQILVIVYFVE